MSTIQRMSACSHANDALQMFTKMASTVGGGTELSVGSGLRRRVSADEWLKAHCVNQLEQSVVDNGGIEVEKVLQSLEGEYATLWEQYEQLRAKSREVIATLQKERDQKIAECENLSLQLLEVQHCQLYMKPTGIEKSNAESNQSELETVRGEYNKLVCSYTHLKLEHESVVASYQSQLEDMKKEQDIEVSSLLEKLKLTEHENDTFYNVHQIRRLQKLNSEFEQKIEGITQELEKVQSEHSDKMSEKDQVILEQSECLRNAQSQIKALEIKCSTLSRTLESTQDELAQCLAKQVTLQMALEQAHRESICIKEGIEENQTKHKVQTGNVELELSQEYRKLKKFYDDILSEKKEYETQLELLQGTIKEYDTLIANKELELGDKLQSLKESEWQKRVALERENTQLQEKVAAHERDMKTQEEQSEIQQTRLQDYIQELSTKYMILEAEVASLRAEQQQQNKCSKRKEMELQIQMERNYKEKHKNLQSQHKCLLEAKQKLQYDYAKLESTVCELKLAVSAANEEVARVTKVHQEALDIERHKLQEENAELLHQLNEEEMEVKKLINVVQEEKKHSKRICKHYKKKMLHLRESTELAKAKQMKAEEDRESVRKSLNLDTAKLKKEIYKLKQRESEFNILLQSDYCCSNGVDQKCFMSKQEDGMPSLEEDIQPAIACS